MAAVDTHCPYCALQCAMTLTDTASGVAVSGRDFPTNRGGLCQKGWTSAALLDVEDRLLTPLIRTTAGDLEPASWDDALALIANRIRALQAEYGPDAVAVFGGGGLTNEKAYLLGKLARLAIGTAMIDYNGRFCMSSAAAAGNQSFGIDRGLPFPVTDLDSAESILLIGSNIADTMPPLVQHLAAARSCGGLIVIDPRRSATAALCDDGQGLHLQPLPGTDIPLLLALLHVLIADDAVDVDFLRARVDGVADALASANEWWPERAEQVTGVPAHSIRQAARTLWRASAHGGGQGAYVLTGRGAEQHANGTDTVQAAINLALALGLPGRRGNGYGALTGQGNGQGGREHGQKADQLPGYRSIADPVAREHIASVWGIEPADLPGAGLPAMQLLTSLGEPSGPKALLVHGSNLVVSAPNAEDLKRRLAGLDLLVVTDFVPSETAMLADVVLPIAQWAEEEGTMTNLEGRVIRRRRLRPPPGEARDELAVIADLAASLGHEFARTALDVFTELGAASSGGLADYAGIDYDRLDEPLPAHWPYAAGTPGTPRLFTSRFAHPNGRARMRPVHASDVRDDVRPGAPMYLITGRVLAHYQSGAQTRRIPELDAVSRGAFVQIHPLTAARLQITDGDDVQVTSGRGAVSAPARLSYDIRPEVVFMPFHFSGEGSVNRATNPDSDPISGMPEFKVCAVDVRRKEA
ncbi:MAG: molybdopterin oxidoreductase family protein [Cumulibacter sp.]